MSDRTIIEYAVFWDVDDPNSPDADVRHVTENYAMAVEWVARFKGEDPPRGICSREVVLTEGEWVVTS